MKFARRSINPEVVPVKGQGFTLREGGFRRRRGLERGLAFMGEGTVGPIKKKAVAKVPVKWY